MKKWIIHLALIFSILLVHACGDEKQSESDLVKIVTTTGMLGDALQEMLGDQAEVVTLMKPGVDPHLFKATQSDLKQLQEADIIIYNGLFLEGKLGDVLKRLQRTKTTIAGAELLPASKIIKTENQTEDPHIWMDPVLWAEMLELLRDQLIALDKFNADTLQWRTGQYVDQVRALDAYASKQLSTISKEHRILITAHDAFGYFGNRYAMEVRGLQGISTLSEFGLRDVSELVDFIVERQIPAIYVESSVSDRSIKAVVEGSKAKGHEVIIGGTLYSDALGEQGSPEGAYLGMFKHNVDQIAMGLSAKNLPQNE
jgi:manganese/zinc/iron transport system substrate-binding protein